ncbi:D-Ala-D-Ala carboxypeptidase family metallohydrolase [Planktomarina sp.]|mgnify:FL=1|jgi:uncharacterized protein YcbK (DUF882 family)|uniref:D-Ala-D-Ala carboxypeptidase family metallohydrolase n=1 Tax=Planktomarina sp. TaxID=2024851 RepID=UPI00326073BB|tara:strand:- start:2496 stop:2849 length:354 start_codon:yes stop_codon:yes gene_type:complete
MSNEFKYFTYEEFNCQETGNNAMSIAFIHRLDELREKCGFPFTITSGYRDRTHSVEAKKKKVGQHVLGIAADIAVADGNQKYVIIKNAMEMGFGGIGVANTFIHVDDRKSVPVVWSY